MAGCDPYAAWPDPESVFPYVYTEESDLEPWAQVRWETETWDPATDSASVGAYILKAQNHRRSAPIESLRHFEAMRDAIPPLRDGVQLDFVEVCEVNRPAVVPGEGTCALRTADGVPRTAAVLYSLGNFATRMGTIELQSGLIASVTLDGGVTGLGWQPIVTWDTERGREVHPLEAAAASLPHAAELDRLTAHLGAGWRR